ncbi:hypothetical protein AT237_06200 [Bartonella henselae]|nr:hypothetical protein AT237_06200 [Bartonella henselae]
MDDSHNNMCAFLYISYRGVSFEKTFRSWKKQCEMIFPLSNSGRLGMNHVEGEQLFCCFCVAKSYHGMCVSAFISVMLGLSMLFTYLLKKIS